MTNFFSRLDPLRRTLPPALEADFGQSDIGHPCTIDFGQSLCYSCSKTFFLGCVNCSCFFVCVFSCVFFHCWSGEPKGGSPKGGCKTRKSGAPEGWGAKFSLFFFPLPLPFSLFFSSLSGGLLVEFWWCLKCRDFQREEKDQNTRQEREESMKIVAGERAKFLAVRRREGPVEGGPAEGVRRREGSSTQQKQKRNKEKRPQKGTRPRLLKK